MKVLMLSTDRLVFEERSGVRTRLEEYGTLCDELAVIVFTLRDQPYAETRIAPSVTLYPTRSRNKLSMLIDAFLIGSRLAKGKKYVVTAENPFWVGLVGYLLARRFRLPLQLQVHTDFLSPHFRTSLRRRIEALLALFLLHRASTVRVVLERTRRDLLKRGIPETRIIVLPIFVDMSRGEIGDEPRRQSDSFPLVVMASRLESEKDIPLALRAFRSLFLKYPMARLCIAGSGTEKENLIRLRDELDMREAVEFIGWQQADDVARLMQKADIFLNTSRFEGYGRTLIEAALLGCPIVTTDVGVAHDILGEREALIVPVGDEDALREALLRVVDDGALRASLAEHARHAVEERIISLKRTYLDAYTKALEKTLSFGA